MSKFTMEEFIENINARGPKSGISLTDVIDEMVPVEEFRKWLADLTLQATEIAKENSIMEAMAEIGEDGDFDDVDPQDILAKGIADAMERMTIAAFASGLFTGLAAGGEGLKKSPKDGWGL